MKKHFLPAIVLTVCICNVSFSQNVGIGNTNPQEKLHVDSGNIKIGRAVLFSGQSNLLKFGDGSFCTIGEAENDDRMVLTASYFNFTTVAGFGGRVGINLPLSVGVPAAQLEVNGTVKISDGSQGSGKVFVSDANGLGTWASAIGFGAKKTTGNLVIPGLGNTPLICNAAEYDLNSSYNPAAGEYTASVTGVYHFDVNITINAASAAQPVRLRLRKNLIGLREVNSLSPAAGTTYSVNLSAEVFLTQGDVVDVLIVNNGFGNLTLQPDAGTSVPGTYFNGHLLR